MRRAATAIQAIHSNRSDDKSLRRSSVRNAVGPRLFKSSNRFLSVVTTETGTTQGEDEGNPDPGVMPIKDWKIDSTQAISFARSEGGIEKGQEVTEDVAGSAAKRGTEIWKAGSWLVPFKS